MAVAIAWPNIIRVWWALGWRTLLLYCVAYFAFILAMSLGEIAARALGVPPIIFNALSFLAYLGMMFWASIMPLGVVLRKDFGSFRLALLARDPEGPPVAASGQPQANLDLAPPGMSSTPSPPQA